MANIHYSDRIRYKLAKRVHRIEPQPVERISTTINAKYYIANRTQFTLSKDRYEIPTFLYIDKLLTHVSTNLSKIKTSYFSADAAQYSYPQVVLNTISLLPATILSPDHAQIPGIIQTPVPFDFKKCSVDVLPLLIVGKDILWDTFPFELPDISDNLFIPLGRCQIKGKNYRCKQQNLSVNEPMFPGYSDVKPREKGLRKSFKEISKTTRQIPDIWDMLLPVLQPPVGEVFTDLLDLPPLCKPYSYQWEGIKFLIERESALLGDDMGTGKTIQSILAARFLFQSGTAKRALILAPISVLPNWDRELEKWAPSLRVTFVRGSPEARHICWDIPAHIWVTTYDTLRQDIDYLKARKLAEFDLVILDEAQKIKNPGTGLSAAVRQLNATYRWGLTGTPIENKIEDLATIFSFLKPRLFPKNLSKDEAPRILQPYFLRRRKSEVLTDLPSLTEYPQWIRLTDEQQQTYEALEKERIVELYQKGKTITAQNILTLIMELKKICNRDPDTEKSAKLDWLLENLEDMTGEDNKALVFTQFRAEDCGGSEWLEDNLSEYGALNYCRADSDRKRKDMLRDFTIRPENKVFIGNPRTAGVGLNELTCANYVVHFDHWWNPAVTNQATARAHRPGQTKNVIVYHLWVEDTIEKMILDKTLAKQRLYDEVIDSLSSGISEDVLFDVYDDLLVKYGFQPLHLGKPVSAETENAPNQAENKNSKTIQTPREFEEVVARLFETMGYNAKLTPYSHDGGVDVIATRASGYSVEKIAIQCKFQQGSVGRPVIQQLLGVISSDTTYSKGYLVTNNDISREAYDLLQMNGRLGAITGSELKRQFEKYGISVTF